jgi:hypothetical protein
MPLSLPSQLRHITKLSLSSIRLTRTLSQLPHSWSATLTPFTRQLHSTPPIPFLSTSLTSAKSGRMAPKKKEEVKKIVLGRPSNNLKVSRKGNICVIQLLNPCRLVSSVYPTSESLVSSTRYQKPPSHSLLIILSPRCEFRFHLPAKDLQFAQTPVNP